MPSSTRSLAPFSLTPRARRRISPWAQDLAAGQAICEYTGPRLPIEALRHGCGTYALAVSAAGKANGRVFIDGNFEHVPYDGPRAVAIYANHSSKQPNALLKHWPMVPPMAALDGTGTSTGTGTGTGAGTGGDGGAGLRDRMWLVAKEPIPRGAEIRFDYEAGGEAYWANAPHETRWRAVRIPAPPPSGEPPIMYDPDGAADGPWLPFDEGGGSALAPLEWHGPHGGVARLRWLLPLLKRLHGWSTDGHKVPWSLVATHVPGRSAEECRAQWEAMAT